MEERIAEMNTGKQLLVDDRMVEDIWNLRREVARPAKCLDNPLIVADRPWEDKGVGGGFTIFDDEEEELRDFLSPTGTSSLQKS